jgi:hypothetical protein
VPSLKMTLHSHSAAFVSRTHSIFVQYILFHDIRLVCVRRRAGSIKALLASFAGVDGAALFNSLLAMVASAACVTTRLACDVKTETSLAVAALNAVYCAGLCRLTTTIC